MERIDGPREDLSWRSFLKPAVCGINGRPVFVQRVLKELTADEDPLGIELLLILNVAYPLLRWCRTDDAVFFVLERDRNYGSGRSPVLGLVPRGRAGFDPGEE